MSKIKSEIETNYENMRKVDEKYQDLVIDIVFYIRSELKKEDAEEVINDVNDILLSAQDRGEDLFEVVGDYKAFCTDIITSYKKDVKGYRLKSLKDYVIIGIGLLIFITSIDILSKFPYSEVDSVWKIWEFKYSLTLATIMNFIISFVLLIGIIKFISKNASKFAKEKKYYFIAIIGNTVIVSIFVIVGLVARKIEIITFERFGIGFILALIILICAIVYLIYLTIKVLRK